MKVAWQAEVHELSALVLHAYRELAKDSLKAAPGLLLRFPQPPDLANLRHPERGMTADAEKVCVTCRSDRRVEENRNGVGQVGGEDNLARHPIRLARAGRDDVGSRRGGHTLVNNHSRRCGEPPQPGVEAFLATSAPHEVGEGRRAADLVPSAEAVEEECLDHRDHREVGREAHCAELLECIRRARAVLEHLPPAGEPPSPTPVAVPNLNGETIPGQEDGGGEPRDPPARNTNVPCHAVIVDPRSQGAGPGPSGDATHRCAAPGGLTVDVVTVEAR